MGRGVVRSGRRCGVGEDWATAAAERVDISNGPGQTKKNGEKIQHTATSMKTHVYGNGSLLVACTVQCCHINTIN